MVYAIDNGLEKIYFTKEGLIYELTKVLPLTERERESLEHDRRNTHPPDKRYYVSMNWLNATADIGMVPANQQSHYVTYGGPEYNSSTYKKLTYTNVYKDIDIEYVIPADKELGIKYNVILRPGADPSDIKIAYSGDVDGIRKNKQGNMVVRTPVDDIIEYAPHSYLVSGQEISSSFMLKDDIITFSLPGYLPVNETIVIDPWVATTSSLTSNAYAYDVDYDFLGNTFIYGGYSPFKVACYSAAGVLQWVFAGTVVSPAWSSAPFTAQASNFGVNKFTSKTYIGQGYASAGNLIIRLNSAGNYDNFINSLQSTFQEVWDMGFHCVTTDVFVLGGGTNSNITAATMNTLTAGLTLSSFQPTISTGFQDIVSHTIDDQGNLFVIYAGNSAVSNKISRVTPSFTNNVWTQASSYTSFTEQGNKNQYQGTGVLSSNGFNALASNANYVFYYDGYNLASYNKSTGALVTATTITGQTLKRQGGIAVDDCNNIYLGGSGNILAFNYNGSAFTALSSISLSVSTTYQNVADIKLDKTTKTLYVCGSGFAGVYSPVHTLACATASSICLFNQGGIYVTSTNITCASLGSATCTATGGTGPFTYTWLPSGQTSSVATGLIPGGHSIIVHDIGANNTYTSYTYISPVVPLTGNVLNPLALDCYASLTGTAAVLNLTGGSGNQSYLWTNGTTTQTTPVASGLGIGNYTVTVTDALTSCVLTKTFSVVQPPQLTLTALPSATSACANSSILITPLVGGGTPNYTYSWTAGPQTGTWLTTQSLGGSYVYTLTAFDSKNCPISYTLPLYFSPSPSLSVASVSVCPLQTGTLTASGALTYTWVNGGNGNSITASPSVTSVYTVSGTGTLCSASATGAIVVLPVPVPTLSSNSPVCSGFSLQLNAAGGSVYNWNGPQSFSSGLQHPVIISTNPAQSGLYTLTVTAANSCTAAASQSVTINPTPPVTASGATICINQVLSLSGSSSFSNCSYTWTGPASYSSSQQNPVISNPAVGHSGTYTLLVTDANGCHNTTTADVTVSAMPFASFSSNSPLCENSTIYLNGTATTGGVAYSWKGPNNFTSPFLSPVISNAAVSASGNYTLEVTNGPCVNSATHAVVVNSRPVITPLANTVCETKKLQLDVTTTPGIISYLWQGPGSFGKFGKNPSRDSCTTADAGVYTVTVIDFNGCSRTATILVDVLPNPVVTAANVKVCAGQSAVLTASGAASYFWAGPGVLTQGNEIFIPVVNNPVAASFTVTGTALNSCTSSATMLLQSMPLPVPQLSLIPGSIVCQDDLVIFTGTGGTAYEWNGPNGIHHAATTMSFSATSLAYSGNYVLTVYSPEGCRADRSQNLQVQPLPQGYLTGELKGCVPFCSSYQFKPAIPGSVYANWSVDQKAISSDLFTVCFNSPGTHTISGYLHDSLTSCKNTLTYEVDVFPKPAADFKYSPEIAIENQDVVYFTNLTEGNPLYSYSWHFINNSGYTSGETNTSYLFETEGIYPVVLIAANEWGCADTAIKAVRIDPDFAIYIPDAFTPNGDGTNDQFMPVMRAVKSYRLRIFDRWDNLLFESMRPEEGWNGLYKGTLCKSDVYIWKIEITGLHSQGKNLSGHVTLLN